MADDDLIIGGYRRVAVMQTGQNSEVWQVVDAATGRQQFAMKLLLPERLRDAAQQRFLRHEAVVLKRLDHPKVIRFYKYGRDGKNPYILMEYFPSQNIKLRLMRGQFEKTLRPRFRYMLVQVSQSLGYLHSKRLVHRDIKPDNLLIDSAGQIKLIDFALAVKSASAFAKRFGRRSTAAGTKSYMSPEQIRGLPVDVRADIYSFGVMIWEMINGRLPFVARTSMDLLRKHIYELPPSFDPQTKVTPEFEALVHRMLAKKEKDRLPDLTEFENRLRSIRIFTDEVDAGEKEHPQGRR